MHVVQLQKEEGCECTSAERDALFFELDQNDDGIVSEEEFKCWRQKLDIVRGKNEAVLKCPFHRYMTDFMSKKRVVKAVSASKLKTSTSM